MRTNIIILALLITSTILCFVMNSWVSIWALLEVNTLSFCSLIKNEKKKETQKNREIIIKYLIIQSIASALLIIASSYEKMSRTIIFFLCLIRISALIIKSAAAPLHQWFINVSKNIKWVPNIILFTWQKMAPLYLVLFQAKKIVAPFIIISAFLGAISIINKKNLKEILAYSSIFNLSWILLAISVRTKIFVLFTLIYWISVFFATWTIKRTEVVFLEDMNEKINKWVTILLIANLAGLPPLVGFIAKWITFSESLKTGIKIITTTLLVIRSVNLYVYMRIVNSNAIKNRSSVQQNKKKLPQVLWAIFYFRNTLVLIRVSL